MQELLLHDLEIAWLIHISGLKYQGLNTTNELEQKIAEKLTKAVKKKLTQIKIAKYLQKDKDIKLDDYNSVITDLFQFKKDLGKSLLVISCDGHGGQTENEISNALPQEFFAECENLLKITEAIATKEIDRYWSINSFS